MINKNTKIKAALISRRMPEKGIEYLEKLCERVFLLPEDASLADPVCHHPDMILTVIGENIVCHSEYYEKNKAFMDEMCAFLGLTAVLSKGKRGEKYPDDVAFNVIVTDKYLFCSKYAAPEVISLAEKEGLETVTVSQGYTACSTLVLDGTLVTADPSIIKAAEGKKETLHTKGGGIELPPYDTGFIGGAAVYLDGTVYTLGSLEGYGGFAELSALLAEKSIDICPFFEGALLDLGGIKFIN